MMGMAAEPKEDSLVTMLNQPFFQVALPLMVTVLIAVWINNHGINKGFDGVNKCIDRNVGRVGRIEDRLLGIETRASSLERKLDAPEVKAWR
jgi:hypothetical protein